MDERKVTLTVEVYGVGDDDALCAIVDRLNEIGYVSNVKVEDGGTR